MLLGIEMLDSLWYDIIGEGAGGARRGRDDEVAWVSTGTDLFRLDHLHQVLAIKLRHDTTLQSKRWPRTELVVRCDANDTRR